MIRKLSATFLFLALHLTSSAQDLDYFAELNAPLSFGDSRFNALAGNMVGMSGSLTALALNPATVGLYRQDAFSASGNIFNSRNCSTNGGTIGNSSNLNVGNVGFVARDPNNGWHVFFSYNCTAEDYATTKQTAALSYLNSSITQQGLPRSICQN